MYALGLKWRLGAKAVAYTDGRRQWVSRFEHFVTRLDIGDLRADGVDATPVSDYDFQRLRLDPHKKRLLFLPGSRPAHVSKVLPFFMHTMRLLEAECPDWEFVINFAPFVNEAYHLAQLKQVYVNAVILQEDSQLVLKCADFICCLPGTNTSEAAFLGVPMLVVLPTNWPDIIQLDGLAGLLGNIPILGVAFKWLLVAILARTLKFTALPNQWAKKTIVPELIGTLRPQQLAEQLKLYLQGAEWRQKIKTQLQQQSFVKPGAARRLVDILETL